jgi:hypothetical protein
MDPLSIEPADVDVGVMQVKSHPRKLRGLNRLLEQIDGDDGIRCTWFREASLSLTSSRRECELDKWKAGDYAVTTKPIGEGTPYALPERTYVMVKEVSDRPYTTEELHASFPFSGIRVVFEALNPREPDARISFTRWESLAPSDDIKKIEHDMTVIAIAATGL